MNAFTELAIFCGEHPEIRAHKRIGELLQATAAELAQLRTQLARARADVNSARVVMKVFAYKRKADIDERDLWQLDNWLDAHPEESK